MAVLVAATSSTAHAEVATIRSIGVLPGTVYSQSFGISGDGAFAVGAAGGPSIAGRPLRWSAATGLQELTGGESISGTRIATRTNIDGSVVFASSDSTMSAYRWTQSSGFQNIGFCVDVVGSSASGDVAAIWTGGNNLTLWSATGSTSVTGINPRALSSNGLVVGGLNNNQRPAIWTAATGIVQLGTTNGLVTAVNTDGSVLAGRRSNTAFRWTSSGGFQNLPGLSGVTGTYSYNVTGISADGSVIAGTATGGSVGPIPFVWTQQLGTRSLQSLLEDAGNEDIYNWTLLDGFGVSSDGRSFTGYGGFGGRIFVGYVATIPSLPSPGGLGLCLLAGLLSQCRRR